MVIPVIKVVIVLTGVIKLMMITATPGNTPVMTPEISGAHEVRLVFMLWTPLLYGVCEAAATLTPILSSEKFSALICDGY